jgi:hypothetical protein
MKSGRALQAADRMGACGHERWDVGGTTFWCHCDGRKKKQNDRQR